MEWIYLIVAGIFEMLGVLTINLVNQKKNLLSYFYLVSAFTGSFYFLSLAMEILPMGTAYAIWTGIGSAGGAILGMLIYGESKSFKRIICILIIIGAAVGLKLIN